MTDYPKLEMETKTTHHVDWNDLAKLLEFVYATKPFELGGSNDSSYSRTVIAEEPVDKWDANILKGIIKHKFVDDCELGMVLNDICAKGAIAPGDYIIKHSW